MDVGHGQRGDGRGAGSGARALESLAVLALALVVLLWNLGGRALWQDEAACAVLGQRLLEHGRPLGYADGNLITMDTTAPEELATLGTRTRDPADSVAYHVERGDFRADTAWIGQPWGSMLVAGLSLELLGHGTLQARLPFAVAGALTVLVLLRLARRVLGSPSAAWLAAALCLGNVYWLLHARQCRYYSLSTLLGLATFAAFLAWRERGLAARGRGPLTFLACAFLWFHVDFGTFVPWTAALALAALAVPGRRRCAAAAFGSLALALLPFALYYRLHDRLKPTQLPFDERLGGLAWLLDRYQLPLGVAVACAVGVALARRRPAAERRAVALALAALGAQLLWMAAVSPAPFYRYLVAGTPLACLVLAWGAARVTAPLGLRARVAARAALGAVALLTPWLALPTSSLFRPPHRLFDPGSPLWRSELAAARFDLLAGAPDPNRAVVRFLEEHLAPGDEVLVHYEDVPLMFYLDVPVRGGIPAFRVEDEPPPRWAVLRRSAGFVPGAPFQRELARHRWRRHALDAPDIPFGHNPDPRFHASRATPGAPRLVVLERVDG